MLCWTQLVLVGYNNNYIIAYNRIMSRENVVRVRLSDIELKALKDYAESIGVPMSEVLRDHVKTLIGDRP